MATPLTSHGRKTTRYFQRDIAVAVLMLCGCGAGTARHDRGPTPQEIEWDIHHRAELDDREAEALSGYASMCHRKPPYVRACYDHARLLFEQAPAEDSRSQMRDTIIAFPNDAMTLSGVKRLARSYAEAEDVTGGVAALRYLDTRLKGSEAHDTLLFETARLQASAGMTADEIKSLEALVTRYSRWQSQLWDDAMWRLAVIHSERGDEAAEKRCLIALLDTQESSWLIGSYTSPFHDDALLRLGEIFLSRGENRSAYEVFMSLLSIKSSRLVDEGLLNAAKAKVALRDRAAACGLLLRLTKEMPESTGARAARPLLQTLSCRSTKPTDPSKGK